MQTCQASLAIGTSLSRIPPPRRAYELVGATPSSPPRRGRQPLCPCSIFMELQTSSSLLRPCRHQSHTGRPSLHDPKRLYHPMSSLDPPHHWPPIAVGSLPSGPWLRCNRPCVGLGQILLAMEDLNTDVVTLLYLHPSSSTSCTSASSAWPHLGSPQRPWPHLHNHTEAHHP